MNQMLEASHAAHHLEAGGPYVPLPNREGPCFLCGVQLDWYETKLIERDGEARISCVFGQHAGMNLFGCASRDLSGFPEDIRKRFRFWTDG